MRGAKLEMLPEKYVKNYRFFDISLDILGKRMDRLGPECVKRKFSYFLGVNWNDCP